MKLIARAIVIAAALAVGVPMSDAWAAHGGGHGGHSGGARATGFHHHHHGRFGTAFVFGGPFYDPFYFGYPYYPPPPMYYGPDYAHPQFQPPSVYVEKFNGTPTAQTPGEIFCPDRGAYYPDVKTCPGGWQRVTRPSQSAAAG